MEGVCKISIAWDAVTKMTIANCWKKTGIVPDLDDCGILAATNIMNANWEDEQTELDIILDSLKPLADYEVVASKDFVIIPEENDAIHHMLSIDEIVNSIKDQQEEKSDEGEDEDEPELPKVTSSKALNATKDITQFLEQQDSAPSILCHLANMCKLMQDISQIHLNSKTQRSLEVFGFRQ